MGGSPARPPHSGLLAWDTDRLVYAVREPFPSQITQTHLVYGTISADSPLIVTSEMARDGRIFSDGIEADYLEFNSGAKLSIAPAASRAILVQP